MSTTSTTSSPFKSPPAVECISARNCLGFGKKIPSSYKICNDCIKRHDPQQLRSWTNNNAGALSLISEEVDRKQLVKRNLEAHGRYLCAFEDPDFQHCRWRRRDLNLRGTRATCKVVKRKGLACEKCWRSHLQKIGIVQYFTPAGLCHEEADKGVPEVVRVRLTAQSEDDDDDVEGYNVIMT